MTRLLVDIGNSRVKWCVAGAGGPGRQQAAPLTGDGAALLRRLVRTRGVTQIVAVCVAGRSRERALRQAAREAGLPAPWFARSTAAAAGVRSGYAEPWRLGADRWVAAIGAWHLAGARRPVCVIDIGTALTIDVVDRTGQHLGGLIVPGPALMVRSLLAGTKGIARRASRPLAGRRVRQLLATDTRAAVESGATLAVAALVDRVVADLRRAHGRTLVTCVTGGAAPRIIPELRTPAQAVPDLVLRGLAVLAPAPAADRA